jgi:hypothetical protein
MTLIERTVKSFCAKILMSGGAILAVATFGLGGVFGQTSPVYRAQLQATKEPSSSSQLDQEAEVTCLFARVSYTEGTVVHGDRVPEQMCVRAPNPDTGNGQNQRYHAEWVRLSKEAWERTSKVVVPPDISAENGVEKRQSLAFSCKPTQADKKGFCGCENSPEFASGALVRSDRGAMQCDHGEWQPLASCVARGAAYPEGTVIRAGEAAEQMCVRVLNAPSDRQSHEAHLDWVRTSKELRDRANKGALVTLNTALCKPAPAKNPGLCGCENFSDFAPKSIMPSANGPIRCEDGEWRPIPRASGPE